MFVEKGIAGDGRGYEIRQGLTGSGQVNCMIFFDDGQTFTGNSLKPLSVSEARNYIEYACR
jgi:hypothetical protein